MQKELHKTVKLGKVSEKGNIGQFTIEGLYTGYGLTMGNTIRRVLLSSIPGAAATQIKIKDVSHEFSTLPGMVEDVVELSLNVKQVRFKLISDEPQTLVLKAKGDGVVTAKDIKTNTFVEVVNPKQKIATLTKKSAELEMELVIEPGLGYVPSENRQTGRLPVGTILLDALFSPIARVDFDVEDMRVGERTNYNRIKLEIETDGTITPTEALRNAIEITTAHFNQILSAEALAKKE
jgi:DNA-directed RNA polymerase subunit alpha